MPLRLHDTATGAVRDLVPRTPGAVGVYLCGATVQASPHIGHLRSAIAFDVLVRWLEAGHGTAVTMVRNVTDIDDKVLAKSAEAGVPWWAWAYRYEREFDAAYAAVGVRPPTYQPRATGHVPDMVAMVEQLVESGHAYPARDGSGDVYFDVRSWPAYGELTHQRVEDMASAPDADPRGKRDPRDFALWKGAKEGEPGTASWSAPFGRGRPGWHLECSAMARRYLGQAFDIHAGGLDLRFPHHENEQAQSRAAGDGFAGLWMHNGLVQVSGRKMGKSLGNALAVEHVLATTSPLVLRYALGAAHYRSAIEHGPQTLADAEAAVARIEAFLRRAQVAGPEVEPGRGLPPAFARAMDDDLNVPAALAVLHEHVRSGNSAIDAGDLAAAASQRAQVAGMAGVLGVDPLDAQWSTSVAQSSGTDDARGAALEVLVGHHVDRRSRARAEGDYETADDVRGILAAAGIRLIDLPGGGTMPTYSDTAATRAVAPGTAGNPRPSGS